MENSICEYKVVPNDSGVVASANPVYYGKAEFQKTNDHRLLYHPQSQYYFEIATGNCYIYDSALQTYHLVQPLLNAHSLKLKLKVLESDIIKVDDEFELNDAMHIGRELYNNNLRLKDLKVSRYHCVIYYDKECYVKDVGSTHGTFVNNKKIKVSKLVEQDLLQIGSSKFRVLRGDCIEEDDLMDISEELEGLPPFGITQERSSASSLITGVAGYSDIGVESQFHDEPERLLPVKNISTPYSHSLDYKSSTPLRYSHYNPDVEDWDSTKYLLTRTSPISRNSLSKKANLQRLPKISQSPQKDWDSVKYLQNKERLKNKFNNDSPKSTQNLAHITQERYKKTTDIRPMAENDWDSIKYIQNKDRLKKKFNIDYSPKSKTKNIAHTTQEKYKKINYHLEVAASVDEPIKDNIGLNMLKKMGWSEGVGLGAGNQGIVVPVKAVMNKGKAGLGKRK
jgi:hypothetical protein